MSKGTIAPVRFETPGINRLTHGERPRAGLLCVTVGGFVTLSPRLPTFRLLVFYGGAVSKGTITGVRFETPGINRPTHGE